ncbi:MAG: ABC transporter permease [Chloroflexi bacterium]|nr:ABC transporter permease [Chloroflexota bacterium]
MTWRILREALWHRKGRAGLALLAIVVGASLVTALLGVSSGILEKMGQELRSYGANIAVTPLSEQVEIDVGGVAYSLAADRSYIDENELFKMKTIFWRNNILGFVPFLNTTVRAGDSRLPVVMTGTWFYRDVVAPAGTIIRTAFAEETVIREDIKLTTGVRTVLPWWQVTGAWPEEDDMTAVLVGTSLAHRLQVKPGDVLPLEYRDRPFRFRVAGLVSTGGFEDDQVIGSLALVQKLMDIPSGANKVMVSALVLPKEKLAPEIRNKKPEEMTPREYEIWYCSPIVEAIAKQIEEVIPGSRVRVIRQIAEAEGAFLIRLEGVITLITVFALAISVLGVMATLNSTILERRAEIGLMKAIGAQNHQIAVLFLAEAAALGIVGGIMGYFLGGLLDRVIGDRIFNAVISPSVVLLPISITMALTIALLGAGLPMRQVVKIDAVRLMRGK